MVKAFLNVVHFEENDVIATSGGLRVALYGVGDNDCTDFSFSVNGGPKSRNYEDYESEAAFNDLKSKSGNILGDRNKYSTFFYLDSDYNGGHNFETLCRHNDDEEYQDYNNKDFTWKGEYFMYQ